MAGGLTLLALLVVALTSSPAVADVGYLYRYAGDAYAQSRGDGGLALEARIEIPWDIAVDSAGNLFFSDRGDARVRRVDAAGYISTVAGGGTDPGGDGGPATAAQIFPYGLSLDAAGNLYIVEYSRHRVRKVDTSGIISTIAGTGTAGFSGDGGPATAAQIAYPRDVAADAAGNVYISEEAGRVRKVDSTGIMSTVAGNGLSGFAGDGGPAALAQFGELQGLTVNATGELFIADRGNNRVRRIDTSGIISTVAGNGSYGYGGDGGNALSAQLGTIFGLAVDGLGNLYIAQGDAFDLVRKVDTSGIITRVQGGGPLGRTVGVPATDTWFDHPYCVGADAIGNVFISDFFGHRVVKVIGNVTCGNGILDPGEACDDGNATGGDCCSTTCQYDAAGSDCLDDGNLCTQDLCDGAGACTHPLLPDADGDGDCDAQDPCTSAGAQTFLDYPVASLTSIINGYGADAFELRGTVTLPVGSSFADLQPDDRGTRLVIDNPFDPLHSNRLVKQIPAGVYGTAGSFGWKLSSSGKRWKFSDRRTPPATRVVHSFTIVNADRPSSPNAVRVIVRGPFWAAHPPDAAGADVAVTLGDQADAVVGRCGETTFLPEDCRNNVAFGKWGVHCRK